MFKCPNTFDQDCSCVECLSSASIYSTYLTRNINVPFPPSKWLFIIRLSINIFLLCQNMTRTEYFHIIINETYNQTLSGIWQSNLEHMSKTQFLMKSVKICRFKTFLGWEFLHKESSASESYVKMFDLLRYFSRT